jgi:hypothetical protein
MTRAIADFHLGDVAHPIPATYRGDYHLPILTGLAHQKIHVPISTNLEPNSIHSDLIEPEDKRGVIILIIAIFILSGIIQLLDIVIKHSMK